MYLPGTYFAALAMLVISMIGWGSWANTFKLAKGYRFELFYWDYIIGMMLMALAYALTMGSYGTAGTPFLQDLAEAGGVNIGLALLSGVIFNVANLLLVAAIEIAGLAVAFPVSIGLALIIGAVGSYMVRPKGNPVLLFGGVALVAAAIVLDALAYRALTAKTTARGEGSHAASAGSGAGGSMRQSGLVLSLLSGVLMGLFYPLFAKAITGPQALGPYAGSVMFVLGAALCTLPVNGLYFMRRPIRGEPVSSADYFAAPRRAHLLGIVGGFIWGTGTVFNFVASAAGMVGPAVSYSLGQGATMVSAIWGVFVWREFRGAGPVAVRRLALMFVFFLAGLALVAIAPLR